jgi:23S rRNA U2552 (ribose-2'-O)-methylase RlmE/FtsJ
MNKQQNQTTSVVLTEDLKTTKNMLVVYQLPKNDKTNILDYNLDTSFSKFPNMPLFKYGFYYYIHQTKNKMEIFEKPDFKTKELHKIINAFEDIVPQEEFIKQFKNSKLLPTDDINSFSIKYFHSDRIISRAFYKLWELLIMFPIINSKSKSFTSLHIAEAPGSFAQSVIYYRHKFYKDQTNTDKYTATSIEPLKKGPDYVPTFNTDLNSYKQFNQWSYKDSDLTKIDIIDKFVSDHSAPTSKADLITADGGFNWKDENYQEQEAYVLLLAEIYCALKTQKTGGSFIIKFFETFTELTIKMIEILKRYYEDVYITKPLLSRPSNSERYIVCLNFKPLDDTYINKIYQIIKEANINTNKFLVDIFPEYQISPNLDMIIKLSSTQMSNEQHKQINEMISYINDGNYFGETYRKYLLKRREANDFWISTFYPISISEMDSAKKSIGKIITQVLDNNNKELNKFGLKLELGTYSNLNLETKSDSESESKSKSKSKSKSDSKSDSNSDSDSISEDSDMPKSKKK